LHRTHTHTIVTKQALELAGQCKHLKKLAVWGCHRLTECVLAVRKRGVEIDGFLVT
jgi:hypothetical protein